MQKKCYITTPIYYANGAPHIGTAYTSLIADIYARIKRSIGYQVKFSTGTDENGQKMKQSAAAVDKDVMEYLDEIAKSHQDTWDQINISYTDFIRTSHPTHQNHVQEILTQAYDSGDVYQGEYTGMYCLGCEAFKKEGDLIEHEGKKVCPDHLKVPEKIKEKNWFFKLSNYTKYLHLLYKTKNNLVIPTNRYNEVKSFVEMGLDDFSISREGSDFGIKMPEIYKDPNSVVYIWFDALYNYLTACKYPQDFGKEGKSVSGENDDMSFWSTDTEVVHTLGKDISRFHAIYWPAMLKSSNNEVNIKEIVNGFFTVDGQKMSKSLGNQIDPVSCVHEYGRDALVYYLFSDIKVGNDGDFSMQRFIETKENVLKKGWGNLVSRVGKIAKKNQLIHIGKIDNNKKQFFDFVHEEGSQDIGNKLLKLIITNENENNKTQDTYNAYLENADYTQLCRDWFELVQWGNKYIAHTEPRLLIKDDSTKNEGIAIIHTMLRYIKQLGLISSPFLVEGFTRLQEIMMIQDQKWIARNTDKNKENLADDFTYLLNLDTFEIAFGSGHMYT